MSEIYIHVGLPKTATTTLQEEVFPNISGLLHIKNISDALQLSSINDKKILWSNEDLSTSPEVYSYPLRSCFNRFDIARNLAMLFPKASIIVCTRDEKSWIGSIWKELVRQGLAVKEEEYLNQISGYDYRNETYLAFLRENFYRVYEYKFEDFIKSPEGEIRKICNFLGCPTPLFEARIKNQQWGDKSLAFTRLLNKLIKTQYHQSSVVPHRLSAMIFRLNRRFMTLLNRN